MTTVSSALRIALLLCALCLATGISGFAAEGGQTMPVALEPLKENGLGFLDAALLGIVEGATEFLPVSSTGHLLLAQRLLGLARDPASRPAANAYAIVIQAGAILAVLGLYRERIVQMLHGLTGRSAAGRRLSLNLVIAFLPAAVLGLLFGGVIKAHLFGLWPVTAAWLGGGLILLFLPRMRSAHALGSSLESLGRRQALGIGLLQCAALWPGFSRSLATIAGGLFVGAELAAAVEFSFLLGLITLGAATAYEAFESGGLIIAAFGWRAPLVGFICAFISAWVSVRWMVGFLQRRGLTHFGWYRILLSLVVTAGVALGLITEI